jgi:hypothetical protein
MLVKIISIMLENTYATDDLVERLALMRAYYGKRLFAGGTDYTIEEVLGATTESHILQALKEWQSAFDRSQISPIVVYEALDAIEEDMAGLPTVLLYVPIRFSDAHVKVFGAWFREYVQPNLLLTMRVDPRVGGGCGFVWHDVYYDFSLRYHIQKNRENVIAMFDQYTHA